MHVYVSKQKDQSDNTAHRVLALHVADQVSTPHVPHTACSGVIPEEALSTAGCGPQTKKEL